MDETIYRRDLKAYESRSMPGYRYRKYGSATIPMLPSVLLAAAVTTMLLGARLAA